MQVRHFQVIVSMVKYGLLFGCLMFLLLMFIGTQNWLAAPATSLAVLWHEWGLPPRGEAAFVLSDMLVFLQYFVIGSLVGLWRFRRLQRRASADAKPNEPE
jgi:hypothetical protein